MCVASCLHSIGQNLITWSHVIAKKYNLLLCSEERDRLGEQPICLCPIEVLIVELWQF